MMGTFKWQLIKFQALKCPTWVFGMVKFAASRSERKCVIGREGWNGMVVNKLMYRCEALVWSQTECNDLDAKQNEMGDVSVNEVDKLGMTVNEKNMDKVCR